MSPESKTAAMPIRGSAPTCTSSGARGAAACKRASAGGESAGAGVGATDGENDGEAEGSSVGWPGDGPGVKTSCAGEGPGVLTAVFAAGTSISRRMSVGAVVEGLGVGVAEGR